MNTSAFPVSVFVSSGKFNRRAATYIRAAKDILNRPEPENNVFQFHLAELDTNPVITEYSRIDSC